MNRTSGTGSRGLMRSGSIIAVVYNSPPFAPGPVSGKTGTMRKTMQVAWIGSMLLAASLAIAPDAPAATPTPTPKAARREDGATKAARLRRLPRPERQQQQSRVAHLAGQSAVYIAEQLRLFKAKVRVEPGDAADRRSADRRGHRRPRRVLRSADAAGLEADPSYWKAGEQLYRKRRSRAKHSGLHRVPRPGRPRQSRLPAIPALRAQHSVYTVKQLTDYANGTRYPARAMRREQAARAATRRSWSPSRSGSRLRTSATSPPTSRACAERSECPRCFDCRLRLSLPRPEHRRLRARDARTGAAAATAEATAAAGAAPTPPPPAAAPAQTAESQQATAAQESTGEKHRGRSQRRVARAPRRSCRRISSCPAASGRPA